MARSFFRHRTVVRRDAGRGLTWCENSAKCEAVGGAEIPRYNPEWGGGELEKMNRARRAGRTSAPIP